MSRRHRVSIGMLINSYLRYPFIEFAQMKGDNLMSLALLPLFVRFVRNRSIEKSLQDRTWILHQH